MANKIKCPLMKEDIEEIICFDISMVADDDAPLWTAPNEATKADNFKIVCKNCPNHRND